VVLAVGGGEGVGGLPAVAEWLATHPLDAQLLVVTGRNRDLYARLAGMRDRFVTPTHLLGYVRNMPKLMRAADVVVTKAGPAAICEAAACGLPIVLTGAIPGQETGNISYVVEHRLGKLGATPDAVARHLGALLRATPLRRRQMRAHALASSRPHAAFDIARLIIDHCPRLAIDAWRMERGS
jgi:1,2-diacylglycerol 3-beta-galactosyltransferase